MQELRAAAEAVQAARRLVVFTGAGMSAESGLPTFRDRCRPSGDRVAPVATRLGARVIQVNPQETPLDAYVRHTLRGPAARILPELTAHAASP